MPPKRSSTEIDCTIIKQGCLIKSPPTSSYIFNNKTSWKGRLLKLCKTALDTYFLRYFAYDGVSEGFRGEIAVSDIKSIESGSDTTDKNMATITRLFESSPENVLCIKTNKRVYYLLDDNVENMKNWQNCITDIWVKINQRENVEGPQIRHAAPVVPPPEPPQDETTRPKSYPEDHPCSCSPRLDTQDRQRSHTDPDPKKEFPDLRPINPLTTLPKIPIERKRSHTYTDATPAGNPLKSEFRRLSLSDQHETSSTDTAYYSDSDIYDVPKSMVEFKHISLDSTEEEESFDSPDENTYELMYSVDLLETNNGDSTSQTQNPLDAQQTLCAQEQNKHCPPKPPRNAKSIDPDRFPKLQGSRLKKAYILKLMYEQGSLDYVKINLTIATAHLQKYLDLQEVGERLCVSKWKGPVEIGCMFHHGDHINELNGFRPESKEFFFQLLDHFTRDKVNLVVTRNKKAGVFHLEGCNCGTS